MDWVRALGVSELPPGTQRRVEVRGRTLRLVSQRDRIFAMNDTCPHMKLSLEGGKITSDCFIICPHHRTAFDLETGEPRDWTPWPPGIGRIMGLISGEKPLQTYATRISDGDILVCLDDTAASRLPVRTIAVTYDRGPVFEIDEGMSVLEASVRHDVDHMHACGGSARCTTCRVEVIKGIEHCPPPDERERQVTEINGIRPNVRLACQLRPTGDITVRVLMQESKAHRPRVGEAGIHELDVAVLFADMRGFTAFAERQLPFDVLHVLNRYFDRMGTIVEMHSGGVLSFQGDGMMCLFGLDGEGDRSAVGAVHAGLEMLEAARVQSSYCADHFGLDMKVGIGIDFGQAVVGEMGYYRNSQLNAIGDVVNTASRLQDLTKELGADLLVTNAVVERLHHRFTLGREFVTEIRGKMGAHRVHEVLAAAP